MYTRLDIVKDAEDRAELVVLKDRLRYEKFIEAGERFAAKNGLIVGGPSATRLLLGDPKDPSAIPPIGLDSFQYEFFSGQAPIHARFLGDAMYELDPQGFGHYTTVLTKVAGSLLTVAVDGRDLFSLTALPIHRGVRTADVVIPSERSAQFAKNEDGTPLKILCMGPEIQLMGIYAALCNPAKASTWGELLTTEASLRALFRKEIEEKIESAIARVGGARYGGAHPAMSRLRALLRDKYASGPSRVLIGPTAISLLTGQNLIGDERLQVITAGALDGDAQEIVEIATRAGFEVSWKIDDPKIPTDPRLRRMTVYRIEGTRREPALDVYNSAEFDLVPYVTIKEALGGRAKEEPVDELASARRYGKKDTHDRMPSANLKIGTPFVLMRYRLIDMWTMQILMRMGAINSSYAKTVLHEMLSTYIVAARYYEKLLIDVARKSEDTIHQLLPRESYIGRLEEPELALKRAAQSRAAGRFYPPYLPAQKVRFAQRESHALHDFKTMDDAVEDPVEDPDAALSM